MPTARAEAQTDRYRYLDHLLLLRVKMSLRQLVLQRAEVSWRLITSEVIDLTGEDLTMETLCSWFRDDAEVQAARAAARRAS